MQLRTLRAFGDWIPAVKAHTLQRALLAPGEVTVEGAAWWVGWRDAGRVIVVSDVAATSIVTRDDSDVVAFTLPPA